MPSAAIARRTRAALLSGDHAGSSSNAASLVNCTGVPPTGSIHKSPSAVNAIARPSGETAGLTMPVDALRAGRLERAMRD